MYRLVSRLALVFAVVIGLVVWGTDEPPAVSAQASTSAQEISHCQNNLKQCGLVIKMYANEHKDMFPPYPAEVGEFTMDKDEVYPEYVTDTSVFVCPARGSEAPPQGVITDESYWYLGYALPSAEVAKVFFDLYPSIDDPLLLREDFEFPNKIPGTNQSGIFRLREGIERFFITDINDPAASMKAQATIPVMIEKPDNHGGKGGNVLFMDGHVEFIEYPGKYPMTKEVIGALKKLSGDKV
jgi:prepilin-type processing-associated H-X9-DG protein